MKTLFAALLIMIYMQGCGDETTIPVQALVQQTDDVMQKIYDTAGEVNATPIDEALHLDPNEVQIHSDDDIDVRKSYENALNDLGTVLFIDGEFRGKVDAVEKIDESTTRYYVADVDSIDEAYQKVVLDFSTDSSSIVSTLREASEQLTGTYDYLNPGTPIVSRFYLQPASDDAARSGDAVDLMLRIDIPKDYVFPISEVRSEQEDDWASCTLDMEACGAMITDSIDGTLWLDTEKTINPSFSITTKGSYITYRIGALVHLEYTNIKYLPGQPKLEFNTSINSTMNMTLYFSALGTAEKEVIKEYNLTKGFGVEIYHPTSLIAKTAFHFQPMIEFGASGKVEAEAHATSRIKRTLIANLDFKSDRAKPMKQYYRFKHIPEDMDQYTLDAAVKSEAKLWAFPNIAVSPEVKFLRVLHPIRMGEIRGGAKIQGEFNGTVGAGYTFVNEKGKFDAYARMSIKVVNYFLLDAAFNIAVGGHSFFQSKRKEIYQSKGTTIFDWSIRVLKAPIVKIEKLSSGRANARFYLDINDANVSKAVKYYYTTDGSIPDVSRTSASTTEGKAVELNVDTNLSVIAVLRNKDLSDSIWAFGTSISPVRNLKVEVADDLPFDPINNSEATFPTSSLTSITPTPFTGNCPAGYTRHQESGQTYCGVYQICGSNPDGSDKYCYQDDHYLIRQSISGNGNRYFRYFNLSLEEDGGIHECGVKSIGYFPEGTVAARSFYRCGTGVTSETVYYPDGSLYSETLYGRNEHVYGRRSYRRNNAEGNPAAYVAYDYHPAEGGHYSRFELYRIDYYDSGNVKDIVIQGANGERVFSESFLDNGIVTGRTKQCQFGKIRDTNGEVYEQTLCGYEYTADCNYVDTCYSSALTLSNLYDDPDGYLYAIRTHREENTTRYDSMQSYSLAQDAKGVYYHTGTRKTQRAKGDYSLGNTAQDEPYYYGEFVGSKPVATLNALGYYDWELTTGVWKLYFDKEAKNIASVRISRSGYTACRLDLYSNGNQAYMYEPKPNNTELHYYMNDTFHLCRFRDENGDEQTLYGDENELTCLEYLGEDADLCYDAWF